MVGAWANEFNVISWTSAKNGWNVRNCNLNQRAERSAPNARLERLWSFVKRPSAGERNASRT